VDDERPVRVDDKRAVLIGLVVPFTFVWHHCRGIKHYYCVAETLDSPDTRVCSNAGAGCIWCELPSLAAQCYNFGGGNAEWGLTPIRSGQRACHTSTAVHGNVR